MSKNTVSLLEKYVRSVPDFPKKGILFRDITPLLSNGRMFQACVREFAKRIKKVKPDYLAAIESRGFILGAAIADRLGIAFVPVRKEGKLPCKKHRASYDLEYDRATIEIHADAIPKAKRVVIVDDVLATGGTADATATLIKKCGGKIVGMFFLIELAALKGRAKLKKHWIDSLITY